MSKNQSNSIYKDVKEPYKYEAHRWGNIKGISYAVCLHCGLVRLRNNFTEWCIKMGCDNRNSPQYKAMRKKAGQEDESTD